MGISIDIYEFRIYIRYEMSSFKHFSYKMIESASKRFSCNYYLTFKHTIVILNCIAGYIVRDISIQVKQNV